MKNSIFRMFYDANLVPCVFTSDVMSAFPCIEYLSINYIEDCEPRPFVLFHWDIDDKNVMAVDDLNKFVTLYKKICDKLEVKELSVELCDLTMIAECSVCGELLMPDDECYVDEKTNEPLCDSHSEYNEKTGNYKKCKNVKTKEFRFPNNPKEKKLHDKFIKMFTSDSNAKKTLSAIINGWLNDRQNEPKEWLSEKEEIICINMIQWLGSPVGQCFLRDCGFSNSE